MAVEHASPRVDGAKVRRIRQISGESITELANRIGMGPKYLADIERGYRPTCSPAVFARICDALGIEDRTELLRDSDDVQDVA